LTLLIAATADGSEAFCMFLEKHTASQKVFPFDLTDPPEPVNSVPFSSIHSLSTKQATMANLTLHITVQTTNDDLRGGSWADFILKLRTSPTLRERL
jgi:antitoxin component of RelBE/YafQ-DinJ toxin-antitoxin module